MSNTAPSRADPVVVFPFGRWCLITLQWYWQTSSAPSGIDRHHRTPVVQTDIITLLWYWQTSSHSCGTDRHHHTPVVLTDIITLQWYWQTSSHSCGTDRHYHTPVVLTDIITHLWYSQTLSHSSGTDRHHQPPAVLTDTIALLWYWQTSSHSCGTDRHHRTPVVLTDIITLLWYWQTSSHSCGTDRHNHAPVVLTDITTHSTSTDKYHHIFEWYWQTSGKFFHSNKRFTRFPTTHKHNHKDWLIFNLGLYFAKEINPYDAVSEIQYENKMLISQLLMPWLHASTSHQQPWYCPHQFSIISLFVKGELLCSNAEVWNKMQMHIYFLQNDSAWIELTHWGLMPQIDGSVQDCSISSALAMEMLQSCTEPLIYALANWLIIGLNNA